MCVKYNMQMGQLYLNFMASYFVDRETQLKITFGLIFVFTLILDTNSAWF